jgi:hypothetical protein
MRVTATSTFHEMTEVSFVGCVEGRNIKRLRGKRDAYCLDYKNDGRKCGCNFPVNFTRWKIAATSMSEIYNVYECNRDGSPTGRGYISFFIAQRNDRDF